MGIAGVGYGSTVPYYQHTNSITGKNAETQNFQQYAADSQLLNIKGTEKDVERLSRSSSSSERLSGGKKAPYSCLAKDGLIEYNGVTFVCDDEKQRICLGNVSNTKECLNIPLSGGGCLVVNRDNLGDLSKAIGMFSPEDVNRILRAIAQDNKAQQMQKELEDDENSIGEAEEAIDGNIETPPDASTQELAKVDAYNSAMFASYDDKQLRENALTDQRYTDVETGVNWYVSDNGLPYMLEEDRKKLISFCKETGEDWLKGAAEITRLYRMPNNRP